MKENTEVKNKVPKKKYRGDICLIDQAILSDGDVCVPLWYQNILNILFVKLVVIPLKFILK